MLLQHPQGIAVRTGCIRMGLHRGNDLSAAAVRKGVAGTLLPVAAVGAVDLIVDQPHTELSLRALQRAAGRQPPSAVVVGSDVGRYLIGMYGRVDPYDRHTRGGGCINGLGVCLVVDGRKHDGLRPVLDRLFNQLILGVIIFLIVGGKDGELHVVLGRGGLSPGQHRLPEFRLAGFGNDRHPVPRGGGRRRLHIAACQQQHRQNGGQQHFNAFYHTRPPCPPARAGCGW